MIYVYERYDKLVKTSSVHQGQFLAKKLSEYKVVSQYPQYWALFLLHPVFEWDDHGLADLDRIFFSDKFFIIFSEAYLLSSKPQLE